MSCLWVGGHALVDGAVLLSGEKIKMSFVFIPNYDDQRQEKDNDQGHEKVRKEECDRRSQGTERTEEECGLPDSLEERREQRPQPSTEGKEIVVKSRPRVISNVAISSRPGPASYKARKKAACKTPLKRDFRDRNGLMTPVDPEAPEETVEDEREDEERESTPVVERRETKLPIKPSKAVEYILSLSDEERETKEGGKRTAWNRGRTPIKVAKEDDTRSRDEQNDDEVEVLDSSTNKEGPGQPPLSRKKGKRKRGRPPISGIYVGIAKSKEMKTEERRQRKKIEHLRTQNEFLEKEVKRNAELQKQMKEMVARQRQERRTRRGLGLLEPDKPDREVLLRQGRESADEVVRLALGSKNLKGVFVGKLKNAAENFLGVMEGLNALTASEENQELRRENAVLTEQLAKSREEWAKAREELARLGAEVASLKRREERPALGPILVEAVGGIDPPPPQTAKRIETAFSELRGERERKKAKGKNKAEGENPDSANAECFPLHLNKEEGEMEVEMAEITEAPCQARKGRKETPAGPRREAVGGGEWQAPPEMEIMMGEIFRRVGKMLEARLEVVEARLPPEKPLRPPLRAAEGKEKREGGVGPPTKEGGLRKADGRGDDKKGKRKRSPSRARQETSRGRGKRDPSPRSRMEAAERTGETSGKEGSPPLFTEVVKRGKGGGQQRRPPFPTPTQGRSRIAPGAAAVVGGLNPKTSHKPGTPENGRRGPPGGEGTAKTGGRRRSRAHRGAAVVLTVPEDPEGKGPTMADVLREATAKIDLEPLGIESLRPKRAMTGALILEVPGQDSAAKADELATKIREAVGDRAKITRPMAKAEIRIAGLVESATAAEVAEAVAKAGGCRAEDVQVGEIRKNRWGLLGTWARCPEAAANKAAAEGAPAAVSPMSGVRSYQTAVHRSDRQERPVLQVRSVGPQSGDVRSAPELSAVCGCGQAGGP